MNTTTIDERIDLGVQWLDENSPGWLDKVRVLELDLSSGCKCVLGQVFSDPARAFPFDTGFYYALRLVNDDDEYDGVSNWAVQYGFDTYGDRSDYDELTEAWRERIASLGR